MANSKGGPSTPLEQKTQTALMTLTLITQACHGIVNTTFIAPSPKPTWFDGLNGKLGVAKTHAQNWIDNLAPGITGGVPVQVINYGTTYAVISASIQAIVSTHPDSSGPTNQYVIEVRQLVEALEQQVQQIINNAAQTQKQLKDWGDLMQASHDALTTGASDIQNAEINLAADIKKMNAAINALNAYIQGENKLLALSAAAIGIGIVMVIAGLVIALETGGIGILIAGTGGLLIVGGAVGWNAMQKKINEQFGEIAKDQQELAADKQQLVALQGLATSSNQAIAYINDATNALSDFRASWAGFQGELNGVLDKLKSAEGALSTLLQGIFTTAAANEWVDATNFAQSLVNTPVQLAFKQLPMSSKAA